MQRRVLFDLIPKYDNTTVLRRENEFPGERRNNRLVWQVIQFFCDFANRNGDPVAKTNKALAKFREIHKASLESDFQGKSNLSLNTSVRDMRGGGFLSRDTVYIYRNDGE